MITGEQSYLQPCTDAKNSISGAIDAVATLTADNPKQQGRIACQPVVLAAVATTTHSHENSPA